MKRWMKVLSSVAMIVTAIGCTAQNTIATQNSVNIMSQETAKSAEKPSILEYVTAIDRIRVPSTVKVVGLGEATHGNAEFHQLKEEVFKALVKNNGCTLFAIEGDFGGAQKVNEYIQGGSGTAEEAVAKMDFTIYKTKEMVHLVEWMREYNESVSEQQKIKFYGFDMQRYNYNKAYALEYLKQVDLKVAEEYDTLLQALNDDREPSKGTIQSALKKVEALMTLMEHNKAQYIQKTSQKAYDFAYQCVLCLKENAHLDLSNLNYTTLRDEYMANKVQWISKYEDEKLLYINAQNAHIMKTSEGISYTTMGSRLSKVYGEQYYAIGTDFIESEFNAKTNKGDSRTFTLTNENALIKLFAGLEENMTFMDFNLAKQNESMKQMLETKQDMTNIGAVFESSYKISKKLYTTRMVPSHAYDGLIVVKKCTPTHMI